MVEWCLRSAYIDFGNFLTGALVTTGIAVPVLLAHTGIITIAAAGMSLAGGLLIYGTSAYSAHYAANPSDHLRGLLPYP